MVRFGYGGRVLPEVLALDVRHVPTFSRDDVGRVVGMVAGDLPLARAFSDLMMSLSIPHYSPITCGRVAECLLHLLTGSKGPAAWAEMRSILHVD